CRPPAHDPGLGNGVGPRGGAGANFRTRRKPSPRLRWGILQFRRMADFKDEISPALVEALAGELGRAWREFPSEAFIADATAGLGRLELLARVAHVAAALGRHLPDSFPVAAATLDAALASPSLDGWMTLPCGYFVAECGIDWPELALPLLARLSPRFSSEGPVRPFIERYPELTLAYLNAWARDPDAHVRRLASETT